MEFKQNADVMTHDGNKVGEVDRVVIDPRTRDVTHIVARKGFLFKKDKLVPVDQIQSATEERVLLKEGPASADDLADYQESQHVPVDEIPSFRQDRPQYTPLMAWYYPQPGAAWWGSVGYPGYPPSRYVRKTILNIPEGTVALEEGAAMVSADGEKIGTIERIYTDSEQDRVTHLLLSRGIVFGGHKLIPTSWIETVMEDRIHLGVDKEFIERLPDYEESGA